MGSDLRKGTPAMLLQSPSVMDNFLENLKSIFPKTVFKKNLTSQGDQSLMGIGFIFFMIKNQKRCFSEVSREILPLPGKLRIN